MNDEKKKQESEMADLKKRVYALSEKAVKASYEPTDKERQDFNDIRTVINNMEDWF